MRKFYVGVVCVLLSAPASSAPIPIHFIYAKPGATFNQFQSDRDLCASHAKRPRYWSVWEGHYMVDDWPSSTVFLKCMAERGYVMAKEGWDTGVLWTLPYLRRE